MTRQERRKLGELLLKAGLITTDQLEDGLEEQKKLGKAWAGAHAAWIPHRKRHYKHHRGTVKSAQG